MHGVKFLRQLLPCFWCAHSTTPAVSQAVSKGYLVKIVEADTVWSFDARVLAHKNSHGVSEEVVRIAAIVVISPSICQMVVFFMCLTHCTPLYARRYNAC